jgi:hypothetical protein
MTGGIATLSVNRERHEHEKKSQLQLQSPKSIVIANWPQV